MQNPIRALKRETLARLKRYGAPLAATPGIQAEKQFLQHGHISCYDHSLRVAYLSLFLALMLHVRTDERSLVRGAILHDYFLYDWHIPDRTHRRHGFIHAQCSLENARRDYPLNEIECDIIVRHMFPMNPHPPRYRESVIVNLADKLSALAETVSERLPGRRLKLRAIRIF